MMPATATAPSAQRPVVGGPVPGGARSHCQAHVAMRARSTGRPTITAAALPGWAARVFGRQQPPTRTRSVPEAQELLQLLTSSEPGAGRGPSRRQVDACIDALLSYTGLPFDEALLGGGPWRVVYTRGSLQLWKATYSAGRAVNATNAASQDLDPAAGRTVLNRAEYLGDRLWVTASGTYEPLDDSAVMPKRIQANIRSGRLHAFGLDVPLPIRGTGQFEVVYLDDTLRVFRSGGAIAVQVQEAWLRRAGLLL